MTDAWRDRAACKGMDTNIFYAESSSGVARAKAICRTCPVRRDCLQAAYDERELFGVFGGLSVNERRPAALRRLGIELEPRTPKYARRTYDYREVSTILSAAPDGQRLATLMERYGISKTAAQNLIDRVRAAGFPVGRSQFDRRWGKEGAA